MAITRRGWARSADRILPVFLGWVTFGLALVAIATPWYYVSSDISCKKVTYINWFRMCTDASACKDYSYSCISWREDSCLGLGLGGDCPHITTIWDTSFAFFFMGMVISFLSAGLTTFLSMWLIRSFWFRFVLFILVLGVVVFLLIGVTVFLGISSAWKQDWNREGINCIGPCLSFSGEGTTRGREDLEWGPGPGWVVGLLTLLPSITWFVLLIHFYKSHPRWLKTGTKMEDLPESTITPTTPPFNPFGPMPSAFLPSPSPSNPQTNPPPHLPPSF